MFREVLEQVVERVDGGMAGLLMGFDGITVERYLKDGDSLDIEALGMEYSVILKEIRKAAGLLELGQAQEVAVRSERMVTIIRMLNEDYFIAVALRPEGNSGKARFLLRVSAESVRNALES